ncbi:hypothetical protein ACPF3S_003157 [Vibrio cholerae]|uniref:hypothetical protein n=1 Tax=Vibrio cholerae TaxID=666 RepID=UPI000E69788A|nr:hypothetical protein [Vibrio cholerae]EKF9824739.1 hypothetical protein [Vibrio cholerae]EKG1750824.1 hypothetical protein [Vibrio cholerae]ELH0870611.1 hypothetical protein [Vibrio cholerae]ELL0578559.1 hypothetical protein [Vibrio cholerae]
MPINEKDLFAQEFQEFLSTLRNLLDEKGLDYEEAADEPDFDRQRINMSFGLDKEYQIDDLIRHIRDNLTNNFTGSYLENSDGQYPLAVWKSRIVSANCWSVEFYFAKNWQLLEDIQP